MATHISIDRDEAIAQIKAAFKARGLRYSVKGGRGTAWGWIHIDLLPSDYKKMDEDGRKAAYKRLGEDIGLDRLCYSSEGIPSTSDYYREYVDRASGKTPSVFGKPYWD